MVTLGRLTRVEYSQGVFRPVHMNGTYIPYFEFVGSLAGNKFAGAREYISLVHTKGIGPATIPCEYSTGVEISKLGLCLRSLTCQLAPYWGIPRKS